MIRRMVLLAAQLASFVATTACAGEASREFDPLVAQTDEAFPDSKMAALAASACAGDAGQTLRDAQGVEDIDEPGRHGQTLLLWVVSCQSYAGAEALLRLGADPNFVTEDRRSPLLVAASLPNSEIFKLLLANGGDISRCNGVCNMSVPDEAILRGIAEGDWRNLDALTAGDAARLTPNQVTSLANALARHSQWDRIWTMIEGGRVPDDFEELMSYALIGRVQNKDQLAFKNRCVDFLISEGFAVEQLIARRIEMNGGNLPVGLVELNKYRSEQRLAPLG